MERIIENKFQKDLFEKYGYVKDEKEKFDDIEDDEINYRVDEIYLIEKSG